MKEIIKNLLPPIFFNFLLNIYKNLKNKKNSYSVDTYDSDLIAKIVIEKNIIFRDNLTSNNGLDFSGLRTIIGVTLAGLDTNIKELNVLDFGGGGGYHYFISKIILNDNIKLNWNVVETKSIVDFSESVSNNELKFYKSIEDASIDNDRFDLIIASSSIQYCKNQEEILRQLIALNSKNIFITRTPFTTNTPFVNSIQFSKLSNNGPGNLPEGYEDCIISYPIYIMNLLDFEKEFLNNYNLKFKLLEEKNAFYIDNVPFDTYGFFYVNKI